MSTTRYGAPAYPLENAAGWLRARASAAGTQLLPASRVDLAAACLAAEAWSAITSVSLDAPRHAGAAAINAAAALYSRAAGHGAELNDHDLDDLLLRCPEQPDEYLPEVERLVAWAHLLVESEASQALRLAATDLAVAGDHSPLTSFAALLAMAADHPL